MSTTTEKPTSGFAELSKNKRVLSWCLLIFILPINFGYELALVGNILAIPSFLNKFGVTTATGAKEISTHDQQILNASTTIGVFVAAYTTGFISDIIGRRLVVLLGCGLCIAGIMVQGFSNSIMMLFGGKLISTVGYGLGHTLGPVYVAEIAPDSLRGLVPPVLVLVLGGLLLPESPTWLLMKGRREEAAKALRKFNGPKHNVEETLAIMETTLEKEKELNDRGASYLECFKGPNLRRTTIVVVVYLAQQLAGSNFVASYLPYFFTIAGVGNPIGIAQVCYSIQLLGNICSWFLVERTGRRPLIVWGIISMSALLLLIGGLSVIENNQQALAAVVAFMALWGFLYQLSIGAVAFAVGGETPSPRLRQKTYSITIMSNTSAGCLVTQLIPFLINPSNANLGGKVAFVFFAPSLICSVYLFFCFPEMKGRSYLELEDMFQKGVPARQFKDYKCEVETVEGKDGEKVAVVLKD
ncbi:General alpha-glucoside permease [Colletotrichum siamense]|uniref:General alpha-glucoside permease n=1 Tax=Colletotrichum siamense TaxID=690259 RepID=UPI001872892F|nr:General alpha-glucoside permease [Colletotrichum siamense]KAF5501396.1 General alpha-glucoside permease [Colletotrichum siamense]